jgi:amino acid adenylation domain-containing protein/non-ribosomal peptide synthase protein (TIGR01720 family)
MLSVTEWQQLIVEWNRTERPLPREQCVHVWVEEQVARGPAATAVVWGDERLTYAELNGRANQLAHYLRAEHRVGPEVVVGLAMERSPSLIVAMLGVLKAGGAYLPLDLSYPRERVRYMLEDSRVGVVLTGEGADAVLPPADGAWQLVSLQANWPTIAAYGDANPPNVATPENTAYVIYTSGSTGAPKGVETPHRGTTNLAWWHQQQHGMTGADCGSQVARACFDAMALELWPCLTVGASVHILRNLEQLSPHALVCWLCEHAITVCYLPTPLAEAVLAQPWPDACALRVMVTGGDRLRSAPPAAVPFTFVNYYGPTEDTCVSTFQAVPAESSDIPPPIGRAIANHRNYVLDRYLQPVPAGVTGDLYLAGIGLARGYRNRPDLTTDAFIDDPFQPGARVYRSGDLVRRRFTGELEFVGRADDQVKIRGFRIEPGEIEAALKRHPDVSDALVSAEPGPSGGRRLVAWVVPRMVATGELGADNSTSSADQNRFESVLKQWLGERLPVFMIPGVYLFLASMPLNANGKVDRRQLPAPDPSTRTDARPFVAPRNQVERELAAIFSDILGVPNVGVEDNFFELGGDSILSIQIVAKANRRGLVLTPQDVFQHQTIAEMAIVAAAGAQPDPELLPAEGEVPLTPVQIWFFEQDLVQLAHFNQFVVSDIPRVLPLTVLEHALNETIRHHDAFRLAYRQNGNAWQQTYRPAHAMLQVDLKDLSPVPADRDGMQFEAVIGQLQESLNLLDGPLVRAAVIDGDEHGRKLLIVIHHLVVDTVSWRILLEDLRTALEQLSRGEPVRLPAKTASLRAWSDALREFAMRPETIAETAYWVKTADTEAPVYPVDRPTGRNTVASSHTISQRLTVSETDQLLNDVSAAYHTRTNEVLLTALALAWRDWTGGAVLLADIEGHGREQIHRRLDVSRTVGWFTSIFPIAIRLDSDDVASALTAVKEHMRAIPNRGLGFGVLRYLSADADVRQRLQSMAQPPVSFNYLGRLAHGSGESERGMTSPPGAEHHESTPDASGLSRAGGQVRRYVVELNAAVLVREARFTWTWSEALHDRAVVERLTDAFLRHLRRLLAHCLSPDAGAYTPSDFSNAELSQRELDSLLKRIQHTAGSTH